MPALSGSTVRVEGLRDLDKAFKLAGKEVGGELRKALRVVGEPVRLDAERLAASGIKRIGVPWSQMRVGITTTSVYVAPRQRGRLSRRNPRLKRPNLAGLLLTRALDPAVDRNVPVVIAGLDRMLGTLGDKWERA